MEDKKMTEQESLELITRMINETQNRTARYAAYPLLIFGYLTVLVSLVIWYAYFTGFHPWQIHLLWFILPLIGGPLTYLFMRKNRATEARNYIDRVTGHIWTVFGTVALILSVLTFFVRIDILFLIPLMMGMATMLSGMVSRYRVLQIAGAVGGLLSVSMLFVHSIDKLLIFAGIFVVMMVIPGHLFNKQIKQCLKN